jgi:hypothetical protein
MVCMEFNVVTDWIVGYDTAEGEHLTARKDGS